MKTIVCDTGPILHLKEANLLKLLRKAGKVYIPEMVAGRAATPTIQNCSEFLNYD